jgi:hypothetical protein
VKNIKNKILELETLIDIEIDNIRKLNLDFDILNNKYDECSNFNNVTSKSIYNLRNIEKNLEIKIRSTHEDYMNKEGSYLKLSTKESLNNRSE